MTCSNCISYAECWHDKMGEFHLSWDRIHVKIKLALILKLIKSIPLLYIVLQFISPPQSLPFFKILGHQKLQEHSETKINNNKKFSDHIWFMNIHKVKMTYQTPWQSIMALETLWAILVQPLNVPTNRLLCHFLLVAQG